MPKTNQSKIESAAAAIRDAEARGLSERTIAKRWTAYFAAVDAAKAAGVWS